MQNQINLTPITQFVQLLRAAELARQTEVKIPIQQARLISLALAELQDKVNRDYETMFNALKNSQETDVVTVQLDGGGFDLK
jgi:hypothetical protein